MSRMWARKFAGQGQGEAQLEIYRQGKLEWIVTAWSDQQIRPTIIQWLWPTPARGQIHTNPLFFARSMDAGSERYILLSWHGRRWLVQRGDVRGSYVKHEIEPESPDAPYLEPDGSDDYREPDRHMAEAYESDPSWLTLPCGGCGSCSDCVWWGIWNAPLQ